MDAAREGNSGRTLLIRVNEPGKTEVNIVLPLGFARHGLTFAEIAVNDVLTKYEIDVEQLLKDAEAVGLLVDAYDGATHVEISVV